MGDKMTLVAEPETMQVSLFSDSAAPDMTKALSDYIFTSKYARYREEDKRRETWAEAVARVEDMHLRKFADFGPDFADEIRDAFRFVYDKRVAPSMRSMQFGGAAAEASNVRMYNCATRHIDSVRAFSEVFYLLLCGAGVGVGLTDKYLSRLPNLVGPTDRTGTVLVYVVEDSVEGWADSIEALLNCYFANNAFSGRKLVYDYSKIRPAGTPLKTSGGRAPGHEGLKYAHQQIKKLLDEAIEVHHRTRLRSLDAYDILMHVSDAVLSGGIRRSAMCAIFDPHDQDMMTAKTGDWLTENPQRKRSNNSVLLNRGSVTFEEFNAIVQNAREWGEPGFVFGNSEDMLFNPCFEISMIPVTEDGVCGVQFCVAGDTQLITRDGMVDIASRVNKDTAIWNGERWVTVKPFQTGTADPLHRVSFSDGSYLDATDGHIFLVKAPHWNDYREMTTMEMREYLATHKHGLHVPRANVVGANPEGDWVEYAYEYGFFKGDGHMDHGVPKFNLYAEDKRLGLTGFQYPKTYVNAYGTTYEVIRADTLDASTCQELKQPGLPSDVASWDEESFLSFMAGWIDADGSQANAGCRLYGDEESLRPTQMLLTKFGIVSSLNLMQAKGVRTNLGVRKSAVWYLQIPNASKIPSRRLDLANGQDAPHKGKWQYVRSVVELDGLHESFCLEEPDLHTCVFNNVLTKQCNLTTINGAKVKTPEDLFACAQAAAFIGTLQATYTDFPYLSNAAKQITEDEALLGVSITGMMENPEVMLNPEVQRAGAAIVRETNERVAWFIGINPAARPTALKPEGTSSLVFETPCSGIGLAHTSGEYFRNVMANKLETPYQFFNMFNGHMTELSVHSATGTDDVITWPLTTREGVWSKETVSALEHLAMVKSTQENWVMAGTSQYNLKPIQHNVSCTITVREHEWDEVIEYIYDNRMFFAAVSLLAATGDKDYAQAPFVAVTTDEDRARFKMLVDGFVPVDYTLLREDEDLTTLAAEAACAGGACELV